MSAHSNQPDLIVEDVPELLPHVGAVVVHGVADQTAEVVFEKVTGVVGIGRRTSNQKLWNLNILKSSDVTLKR